MLANILAYEKMEELLDKVGNFGPMNINLYRISREKKNMCYASQTMHNS